MFATAQKANAKPSNSSLFQRDKGNDAFIQPKLNVGKPGDIYEVEADRVADTVVARGNETKNPFFSPVPTIQRQTREEEVQEKCTECEKEEGQIHKKPLVKTITPLVRKQPEEEQLQETENVEGEIQRKGLVEERVQEKAMTTLTPSTNKQEEVQEKEEEGMEDITIQPKKEWTQRKNIGVPIVSDTVESRIQKASGNGKPLDKKVKGHMESGFGADFSNVRVHTDQESSSLNNHLSARAFTHKSDIFFGQGQYRPETANGKHLLAHELTHVVQQGHAVQRKPEISTQSSAPKIQRLGISDALDYFADKAYLIPGFRMFTIILGVNPINMSGVDRSAANIMRAIVEFLPGGNLITRVLDKYNVFTDAANLMKETLDTLSITGQSIKNAIDSFLDSLGWSDIFDLGGVWERAKRIFTSPINSIINLGKTVLTSIYELVRKAILAPLAQLAKGTRGYDLLKALLGKDPITGEAYPSTPETVIGGFMKLIGQEEIWENIVKGNAVGRAWAWFKGAISGLMAFVFSIPTTIVNTIKSLTWDDIIILPKAFLKVGKAFVSIASTYINWGLSTVFGLLEILFSVVAPGILPYIKKAKGAFTQILKNPIGFIGNLVRAVKNGFQQFATNILEHLKKSLLNWLLGSLAGAGIYIPQALNFKEIIKFVASVLGLTWENLRLKLVEHLGEPAVKALEAGFELVQLLITEGPAAAWEKIMEHLGNLKEMVIQEITQFVVVQVVQKAIAKLLLSLNPAGAVIQAIIAIYDTITFLVEKIKQIAQVGMAVIDSIAAIATGVLTQAANKVEQTLARMLTLAINFLAKFAGLGKISEAIIRIIEKIRQPINRAMDKVVGWVIHTAKGFLKGLMSSEETDPRTAVEKERDLKLAVEEGTTFLTSNTGKEGEEKVRSKLFELRKKYNIKQLDLRESQKSPIRFYVHGELNPIINGVEVETRYDNQTCLDERLDELQIEMHRVCDERESFNLDNVISKINRSRAKNGGNVRDKDVFKGTETKGMDWDSLRNRVSEEVQLAEECERLRENIQIECFGGEADEAHEGQIEALNNRVRKGNELLDLIDNRNRTPSDD